MKKKTKHAHGENAGKIGVSQCPSRVVESPVAELVELTRASGLAVELSSGELSTSLTRFDAGSGSSSPEKEKKKTRYKTPVS